MEILAGICIGIFFFVSNIIAYAIGVKHGRIVKDGGIPNINPIKAYKTAKNDIKTDKQFDLFSEGLNNILNYGEKFEQKKERR